MEGLNRAVEPMLLAALPRYARQAGPGKRPCRPKDEVLLSFEDFTGRLLGWTRWWNTEHRPQALSGRTPLEAWQADPTPVTDISAADLWTFTLEDDGRPRKLTSHGVRWCGRTYIAPVDDGPGRLYRHSALHAAPRSRDRRL
ncbi:hypothetical protein N6H00_00195 [Streptomyces sp. S465]|nr:hypothetical protein [Streptomyces sp. S465]WAP53503.1 hypothetical protein N6H00_00195 [Streptomyces sp. S465]